MDFSRIPSLLWNHRRRCSRWRFFSNSDYTYYGMMIMMMMMMMILQHCEEHQHQTSSMDHQAGYCCCCRCCLERTHRSTLSKDREEGLAIIIVRVMPRSWCRNRSSSASASARSKRRPRIGGECRQTRLTKILVVTIYDYAGSDQSKYGKINVLMSDERARAIRK